MNSELTVERNDLPRVAIIGGGLAGMSAAESIARRCTTSVEVHVFEAKRTTGGRAGSFQDPQSGEIVDYCQHVAMGCCTNLIGLLDRCGQLDHWHRDSNLEFRFPGALPTHFAPSRVLPPPIHLLGTLWRIRYLQKRQILCVLFALGRLMRTSTSALQNITAADWMLQNGQDEVVRQRFWDVILVSALGEKSDAVSMAAARKVIIDGFASARGASDLLIPSKPLSELFGHQLTTAIERLGVKFHTQSNITALSTTNDGQVSLISCDQTRLMADHVIIATAWQNSAKLLTGHLPRSSVDSLACIRSSSISGVHLWFDRELTDRNHAVLVGGVSQWMFRPVRDDNASSRDFYYQVVISASADVRGKSKDELIRIVVSELRELFPGAREAKLVRGRVVTDPNSVFSVRPDTESIRPDAATALPWLHLAGDWTRTGWPSTMEGAVISGRLAANSVLERLGCSLVKIDAGPRRGWLAKAWIKK